jgi:uncharacterized protein YukE
MAGWTGTRESRGALLFFAIVAAGCGYIVLAKIWGVSQAYVTFVPVGLMVGYALLLAGWRSMRLRDDQAGDNLYYLGFLYTLTSLGVSLFQFSAKDAAADRIVQNFGIAIATTIAGVGLRIVFNQMRRDPVEVERVARLELADAARRVRKELDATVVELAHSRRATQQVVFEGLEEVARKVDQVAGRIASSLDGLSRQANATVETTASALAQEVRTLSAGVGRIVSALEASEPAGGPNGQKLGATIEELSRRLAEVAEQIEKRETAARDTSATPAARDENGAAEDGKVIRLGHAGRRGDEGA